MTTYVPFTPSLQAPFQFQATLDGEIYTVQCTWNLFGQRFYINVYDTSGNLIVATPQVGSPPTYNLNLVAGYFQTSVLVYRQGTGNFEVDPATPPPLQFPIPQGYQQLEFFRNDGGVLVVGYVLGYPVNSNSLLPGAIWNNGGAICVVEPTTPNPSAPPVFFGSILPSDLLLLGGGNLPTTGPATGTLQLWNNGGLICIA